MVENIALVYAIKSELKLYVPYVDSYSNTNSSYA